MKAITKVRFLEEYLPTPRCRKLRTRDVYADYEYEVRETTKDEAPVAVIVHDLFRYRCELTDKELRLFGGVLYAKQHMMDFVSVETETEAWIPATEENIKHYIDWRAGGHWGDSSYDTKAAEIRAVADDFLLIDGEVWKVCGEPMYCIYTFGLGHNHASTCLSVDFYYNSNISHKRYFNALEREKAIEEAVRIAKGRGDTDSIERIKNEESNIIVLDPSVIHRNPVRDHGDGSPFLASVECVINASDSAGEAGILTMLLAAKP